MLTKGMIIIVVVQVITTIIETVSGQSIDINLSGYDTTNKAIFKGFYNLSSNDVQIKISGISRDIGYVIVQAHSFIYNLTLASDGNYNDKITGNNVGLYYGNNEPNITYYLHKENDIAMKVLLVLTLHDVRDPIPGGCNLSFDNEIAPYQILSYDEELITVKCQAPSIIGFSCDSNKIAIEVYHMYLTENNLSESLYFDSIEMMLSVNSIKKMGRRVGHMDGRDKYKMLYSAYQGTGEVFAVIAVYKNRSAAYVPTVTYACDLSNSSESCNGPVTEHWKILCAFACVFGLFICFFGHKFFRTSVFLNGFITGVSITYVSLYYFYDFSTKVKVVISVIMGVNHAVMWLYIWWQFGVPLLSITLSFILSGFIISSIVFYVSGLADLSIFHNEVNFWMTFACFIICNLILCTMSTHQGHIFCCSLLGSYAFILTMNYYVGGNLQYIILNSYKRLTVKDFNVAVIDPPFQLIDFSQALLWIVLVINGVYYQCTCQRGKPPFPPHRNRSVRQEIQVQASTERTPLLPSNLSC